MGLGELGHEIPEVLKNDAAVRTPRGPYSSVRAVKLKKRTIGEKKIVNHRIGKIRITKVSKRLGVVEGSERRHLVRRKH